MKKAVLALAAIAIVACFSFTSCKKKCTCKTPIGEAEWTIDEVNEELKKININQTIEKCTEVKFALITCE